MNRFVFHLNGSFRFQHESCYVSSSNIYFCKNISTIYIFLQNYFERVFVYRRTLPRLPPLSKWWRCEAAVQGYWDTAQNIEFFLTTHY